MSIKFEITKQNNIHFGIAAVAAALVGYFTSASWWVILLFAAAYFGLINVKLELPVKLSWLWATILLVIGAILSVFSVQYVLLTDEDFVKTTDMVCVVNVVLALAIYLVILFITNNTRLTCTIASIAILAFGFIDYFVYEFRGNEFTYADLKSAGTGLSVVTKYKFVIDYKFLYVILAAVLYIMLVRRIEVQFESAIHMRIISILLTIICVLYVIMNSMSLNTETWEKKGTYRNGYLLNFVLGIRDSFVKAPDGYSKAAVDKIAGNFKETDSSYSQSDAKNPTIIVIMNESFADLSVVGDFETNTQVTPFMDSLSENTLKGYALSSVYGAKTPNSEWEFETGNSMAFLPDGSVVYQQYINDDPTSIVSNLKNIGYTTVAMHPYYATGWSRNKVYPHLGYDETYFIDDFDQTKILREYITDQELYDKIIDRYEKKSDDEKLYIMGVTMQNHGGYGERYDNFNQEVYKVGASYTDANQYLSLLNESDKALENLITYFKGVDDPVEIVFFGDHQPGLCNDFIKLLNGKGNSGLTEQELENLYKVPFFIWTNYETDAQTVDVTSLNYLSTLTLERANIDLPAYNRFLAELMEKIPAINSRGYYSKKNECFMHVDDATGDEAKWIKAYNILQYNSMFDEKDRSSLLFPYLK